MQNFAAMEIREARYRFSDDVRHATRGIALRMIHAGRVAGSPEALGGWIAETDDVRERLTKEGYGTDFDAADLFPLFEGFVAKASPPVATSNSGRSRGLWIGSIVVLVVGAVILAVWLAA